VGRKAHGRKLTHEADRLGSTIARLKLKGIDGDLHNQWSMWFNSRRTEEPYPGLTFYRFRSLEIEIDLLEIKDGRTGVAWPSSARAVGCSLQWGNERNPCQMLNIHLGLLTFGERKWGRRQVSMALISGATHMLQ
jgi:hypothetical protein